MRSYWEEEYWKSSYDFIIIGLGIVGINTAIDLKNQFPDSSIAVVERGRMPSGASTKNAGFACFGTVGEILDDLKAQDEKEVIETIGMRWQGLQLLKSRVPEHAMDYKNLGGTEVFTDETKFEECESNLEYVNSLIERATSQKNVIEIQKQSISSNFSSKMLFNKLEGQLNPVLMMKSLISTAKQKGVEIYTNQALKNYVEHSNKVELELMNEQRVECNQLIFCTNAFTNHFIKDVDVIPGRNQVLVSEPIQNLKINGTFHYDCGYIYFRNIDNRLLIGGARNIDPVTETTTDFGKNDRIISYLKDFVREKLAISDISFEYNWSGIIATGKTKKPIVQRYSDRVVLAVRLGGMGVAVGSHVAKRVVELF